MVAATKDEQCKMKQKGMQTAAILAKTAIAPAP